MTNQDRGLDALVEQIRRDRGFDGSQYKQSFLKRRLAVRMRARGHVGADHQLELFFP